MDLLGSPASAARRRFGTAVQVVAVAGSMVLTAAVAAVPPRRTLWLTMSISISP